jgi:hypothetical protein
MSDGWYYADDGAPKGPMSLDDLGRVLSVMHDPSSAMVWRAGFQGWQKAADVAEIAARIFKPPPLPPPPLPPRPISRPIAIEPGLKLNIEPLPIGGWLILVAIGQTLGPLRLIGSIGQYYATLDWKIARAFPAAFFGEALLNTAYLALIVYTTVLFWRKSRHFPRYFWYETLATLIVFPLNAVWVAMTISIASGRSFSALFAESFEPQETGRLIAAVIAGFLWTWYLYKSKRVAKTFIR